MLESVISITPILFVQMGQEEAGAIDFRLTYDASSLVSGDVNFYAVNPFTLNYTVGNYSYQPLNYTTPTEPVNKAKSLLKSRHP